MRFLVDENVGPAVSRWLRRKGHDVFSVYEQAPGIDDDTVLEKERSENRILITNDKDFGDKVYREKQSHRGVILLRLDDERSSKKIKILEHLIAEHAGRLPDNFIVATDKRVRFSSN
jgi:predicted nuclease of predicted toxin-antitoxin system